MDWLPPHKFVIEELNSIPGCESVSCSQYGNFICRYSDASFIQQVQSQSGKKTIKYAVE